MLDLKATIYSQGYFKPSRCVFENTGDEKVKIRCYENSLIVRILKFLKLIVDVPVAPGEVVHFNKTSLDNWLNKNEALVPKFSYQEMIDYAIQTTQLKDKTPEEKMIIAKNGILSLFKDQKTFDELPFLENVRVGETGYLEIEPTDLLANPMMRGVDRKGREFCVIRVKGNNQQKCLIVFQREKNSSTWAIAEPQGSIINKDRVFQIGFRNNEAFELLKELATNKKLDHWEVE